MVDNSSRAPLPMTQQRAADIRSGAGSTFTQRLSIFFGGSWLLTMIFIPILGWIWGEAGLQTGMISAVFLQVTTVSLVLLNTWKQRRLVVASLAVVVFAWAAEALGSATGFPFGGYEYTAALQPQLAGVPLLIPFAWLMARKEFPLKRLVSGIIDLPIVIPHSAAGIAILGVVSRNSVLGQLGSAIGMDFVGAPAGIALAMAFVSPRASLRSSYP